MAGSRLEKFGTIFTRVEGLLKSGAIRVNSKPLWYDVYKAFPPQLEPNMFRAVPNVNLINILYPEDYIRARFYNTYGSPGIINLDPKEASNHKNLSQIFVDKYIEIARKSDNRLTDDQIFKSTEEALISKGFKLKSEENQASSEPKWSSAKEMPKSILGTNTLADIVISDN